MIKGESIVLVSGRNRTFMTIRVLTDQRWLPTWNRLLKEGQIGMSGHFPVSLRIGSRAYKSHGVMIFIRMEKRYYGLNTPEVSPTGRWLKYSEYLRVRNDIGGLLENEFVPLQPPTRALVIERNYDAVVAGQLREEIRFALLYQRPQLDAEMFDVNQEYQKRRVLYEQKGSFDWTCQEGEDREHRNNVIISQGYQRRIQSGEPDNDAGEIAWLEYMKQVRENPPYSSDNHARYCYSLRSALLDYLLAVTKGRRTRAAMDRRIDKHRRDLRGILEVAE